MRSVDRYRGAEFSVLSVKKFHTFITFSDKKFTRQRTWNSCCELPSSFLGPILVALSTAAVGLRVSISSRINDPTNNRIAYSHRHSAGAHLLAHLSPYLANGPVFQGHKRNCFRIYAYRAMAAVRQNITGMNDEWLIRRRWFCTLLIKLKYRKSCKKFSRAAWSPFYFHMSTFPVIIPAYLCSKCVTGINYLRRPSETACLHTSWHPFRSLFFQPTAFGWTCRRK